MSNEVQRKTDQFPFLTSEKYPVLDHSRLIDGSSGAEFVKEHVLYLPTRTILYFGEPGLGKTVLVSDTARALRSMGINVRITTYDSESARIVDELQREKPEWTDEDYDHLSDALLKTYERRHAEQTSGRTIDIVELVGIGMRNRGSTTLAHLAELARSESPEESSILVVGVVADLAIQEEAALERKKVERLRDNQIITYLRERNLIVEGLAPDSTEEESGRLIKAFYSTMARGFQIDLVRREVEAQAESYIKDDLRIFDALAPQVSSRRRSSPKRVENYRKKAGFLQLFLEEQGLLNKPALQLAPPTQLDKGIVLYNPYNPNLVRRLDLSAFRNRGVNLSTHQVGMY